LEYELDEKEQQVLAVLNTKVVSAKVNLCDLQHEHEKFVKALEYAQKNLFDAQSMLQTAIGVLGSTNGLEGEVRLTTDGKKLVVPE